MQQVFVSYAHVDWYFAQTVAAKLAKLGYHAWIDDKRIGAGYEWSIEIDNAINESSAIVVILTPEAKESEYVTYEWSYALGKDKALFPLIHRPVPLHQRLQKLQFCDFTFSNRHGMDAEWKKLAEAISRSAKTDENQRKLSKGLAPYLRHDLSEGSPEVRINAAAALERSADADYWPIIREFLHDRDPEIRLILVRALQKIYVLECIPFWVPMLTDRKQEVRVKVVSCLVHLGTPVVPSVTNILFDTKNPMYIDKFQKGRINAALVLGRIGTEECAQALLTVLQNESDDVTVRCIAADALADMRCADAIPYLEPLLYDDRQVWWYSDTSRTAYGVAYGGLKRIGLEAALLIADTLFQEQTEAVQQYVTSLSN